MTGAGAHRSGGRWNSPGHRVVYTSGNLTLAMLELLVHIDDAEQFRLTPHVYVSVRFPETAIATLHEPDLPAGWDSRPGTLASQVAGDEWLDGLTSPVLAVPSVLVPPELRYESIHLNYLVNPEHPDFAAMVSVGSVQELTWDQRLAGSRNA